MSFCSDAISRPQGLENVSIKGFFEQIGILSAEIPQLPKYILSEMAFELFSVQKNMNFQYFHGAK